MTDRRATAVEQWLLVGALDHRVRLIIIIIIMIIIISQPIGDRFGLVQ